MRTLPLTEVQSDPIRRAVHVDDKVLVLGKGGFLTISDGPKQLCSRCLEPLASGETGPFCKPCDGVIDGVLARQYGTTS
ncbi:MAG: hypothetical protein HY567_02055 [Candidatus Kerfeldbacteria bacterium]|nr:hypothetical protein [Candidatus Kerfeldbacteria bacterium]